MTADHRKRHERAGPMVGCNIHVPPAYLVVAYLFIFLPVTGAGPVLVPGLDLAGAALHRAVVALVPRGLGRRSAAGGDCGIRSLVGILSSCSPPCWGSLPPTASPATAFRAARRQGLLLAPLTVSYLIIGLGLLATFNALGIAKSLLAVGIGHVVINLPLCFAILHAQMGEPQARIERAARDLGAAEWQVLVLITVPLLWPALFAAFFLAFTLSWDEFIIAFLLTRFDVTLPVEIWSALRTGLNPATNAVGSLVFAVSMVLVVAVELALLRRRKPS